MDVRDADWLGLPEGEWTNSQFAFMMSTILTSRPPDVVYAPSRIDFHPEHYAVARALACLSGLAGVGVVRVYQVQVPLTSVLVNLVAPIAPVRKRTLDAFRCYASQEGSLRGAWRLKAYAGQTHHLRGEAEEFWEMTPRQYVALHAQMPSRPLVQTFRALRRHAYTDPLAFTVGRSERRRLLQVAALL
jgi:hypothetical protein